MMILRSRLESIAARALLREQPRRVHASRIKSAPKSTAKRGRPVVLAATEVVPGSHGKEHRPVVWLCRNQLYSGWLRRRYTLAEVYQMVRKREDFVARERSDGSDVTEKVTRDALADAVRSGEFDLGDLLMIARRS